MDNPTLSAEEVNQQANQEFKDMLLSSFYEVALAKLSNEDSLKQLELEDEYRFLDIRCSIDQNPDIRSAYAHLYHGVRMDPDHKIFESILRDHKIKCSNKTDLYYRNGSDNCNEGEYVSLIHFEYEHEPEFQTFIEENVSFIISPRLNPVKCKYLPFEEWEKIKEKLPKTKHRYSYAKNEYQYPDYISFDYVVGILYPLRYYNYVNGFYKTQEDFAHIKELLKEYGLDYLPILDPTAGFIFLNDESMNDMAIRSNAELRLYKC